MKNKFKQLPGLHIILCISFRNVRVAARLQRFALTVIRVRSSQKLEYELYSVLKVVFELSSKFVRTFNDEKLFNEQHNKKYHNIFFFNFFLSLNSNKEAHYYQRAIPAIYIFIIASSNALIYVRMCQCFIFGVTMATMT